MPTLPSLRRKLLRWFDRAKRDLPWRRDRDPYRIWVSEVMLQQTQVATVIPYFERFLVRFPTVADLAAADEQDVLRQWAGLGYYRRARHLHQAARIVMEECGGELPNDLAMWDKLPGVGRYILGAVLSQAFDRRLPIVEANTKRLLCRLFAQRGDPATKPVQGWLWETAATLLPRRRVGDFNQALMELGALVCIPQAPRCGSCPIAHECAAHRDGLQHVVPAKSKPKLVQEVREVALVIRRDDQVLLVRRPADSKRWANMWEFPHIELEHGEDHAAAARRMLAQHLGLKAAVGAEVTTVRHSVTRFRIEMMCLEAEHCGGQFRPGAYAEAQWVTPGRLADYPISAPQRLLAEVLAPECLPSKQR